MQQPELNTLADRLASARNSAGLTQKELAARAGVSQGAIANLEAGARLQPRSLLAIADALGVAERWLLNGDGGQAVNGVADESAHENAARSLCALLGIDVQNVDRVVITIDMHNAASQSATAFTPAERADLAKELGVDPLYLYQLLTGRREMEPKAAVRLEQKSGGRLRRWHLRAKTWHEVWPELIGAEGAPPVPTEEARDAA